MIKKSGYKIETYKWEDEYYQNEFESITDFKFEQNTFESKPALVSIQSENGYRIEKEYRSQEFNPTKFRVVEKRWDHEHCKCCLFTIDENYSYWENSKHDILCDVCYEYFHTVFHKKSKNKTD